jgi:DNA (cytosine-5)-methyltransferase 1
LLRHKTHTKNYGIVIMSFRQFISRKHRYVVKHLKNGAARIYVQNSEALQSAGFLSNSNIRIINKPNRIEVHLDPKGTKKIMDTGRGELLELKNKDTAKAMGQAQFVSVTFRMGVIVIAVHGMTEKQQIRESGLINKLVSGEPLRKGCFFSGLGMLSFSLKEGLKTQGIESQIAFANDNNELAMACNLAGNPMWDNPTKDASVVVDDLHAVDTDDLPQVDYVTVGYPCVGFSLLAKAEKRDLLHPDCGTLFVPLIAALRKMNPAVIVFENTPRFGTSDTLDLIKRSMPDYNFTQSIFNGHDFNELESRKRVCVVATSKGLPTFDLSTVTSLFSDEAPTVISDHLSDVDLDAPFWRTMEHVKARDDMKHLGYRNCLYYGDETKMVTLPASYGAPKAGTPMIAHPTRPDYQRQVQVDEHVSLRALPERLGRVVIDVWKGVHPLVSVRGSASAAHRLLGNGVSRKVWKSIGAGFGRYLNDIRDGSLVPTT